ncbi:hypothetical protein QK313_27640, partial [Klebsiella michiganensis]|uniref:hypothetical protein n=1 Tax=Klebsiella michiganensis TaxID=1134687 RepID=UPI00249CCE34
MRNNPWKTELKVARSQRNKLQTMSARLTDMTCEWDGLSGWLETESERLVEWICPYISRHLLSLNPLLACCRRYSRGER